MNISRWYLVVAAYLLGGVSGWLGRGGVGGGAQTGGAAGGGRAAEQAEGMGDDRRAAEAARPRVRSNVPAVADGDVPGPAKERYLSETRRDMELQLANWVAALGLQAAQVERLKGAIDRTMEEAGAAAAEGTFHGPWVDGAALVEALETVLDDAQRQGWQDWQKRRGSARAEARAAAALAEIEGSLLLDATQRQQAREVLLQQAQAQVDSVWQGGHAGISPDVLMEIQRRLGEGIEDPAAFESTARQVIGEKVEQLIAPLQGILRPEQQEAYRRQLLQKHGAWLGPEP